MGERSERDRLPPLREIDGRKAQRVARAPVRYTQEIAEAICDRIADGESLREVCRSPGMPDKVTVLRWLNAHEDFRTHYARARDIQTEVLIDEIVGLSDSVIGCADAAVVNGARLAIDTRKWIAGKQMPKKYGERTLISGDPDAPLQTVTRIELVAVAPSSAVDLANLPLANVPKRDKE